jgi:hypothetical protein
VSRGKEKQPLEDPDPQLQNLLRARLQKPGDLSAMPEKRSSLLAFRAKARTSEILTTASLSILKRSHEEWHAQQPD